MSARKEEFKKKYGHLFPASIAARGAVSSGGDLQIEEIAELPAGFDALLAESRAEGWRFLHRLDQEFRLAGPSFSAARGSLFAARRGDELLGVCVLCRDPFLGDPDVGRLRHLYVAAAARHHGVGRRLVGEVVQRARQRFQRLRLRTESVEAGLFYVALGFAPTTEEGATHELILTQGPSVIEYLDEVSALTAEELGGFFEGWPNPPSPEGHLRILRASYAAVVARDVSSRKVVGFGTAISDGVLAAYLSLLEVRPGYRKRGIGSEIARRLLTRLEDLYMVDVVCDAALEPLYSGLDLTPARAMVRRNFDAQSGWFGGSTSTPVARVGHKGIVAGSTGSVGPPAVPISLRVPTESDAEFVFEAVRESMAELGPWMNWCVPGYSVADARSWALETSESRANRSAFSFLVVDDRARVLGVVGLNQINQGNGFANLGYWVRTSEAGRGIAATAVSQLERWAFAETTLRRLEVVIAVGNARSQRVAEKAGASFEGILRSRLSIHGVHHDAFMYSLIRPSSD